MKDIHYACNNPQVCNKKVQPDKDCKKDSCRFCIETEIYVADKSDRKSLEWQGF